MSFATKEQIDDYVSRLGVNYQDLDGNTLLHHFAKTSNKMIKYLITIPGIHINITNNLGQNALFEADDSKIIEILLISGINHMLTDKKGNRADEVNEMVDLIVNQRCLTAKRSKMFRQRYAEYAGYKKRQMQL